ncbi:glycosyltransferase [Photobacterium kishitanii]|uniref:glycosyltransferase n=1 Tax=Photobacterium kishitanii TaxID=318456 RepID=UPI000D15AE2D|nr:glycosyltransferase [Photobacterium kishitanii]PSV19812.1 hypothetical protein C0W28_09890 [Photobacterium kishitanii]
MKILVASSYHHAWNSVRPEAEMLIQMVKQGHQVTIATQGDADYVARFRDHGVKVIDCYPTKKICPKTIRTLHHELKTGGYDICYGFNSKTIPNAAFACIGTQVQPSISEDSPPRTIIEVMANGTTSVITTTGASPELVDDKAGYIVPVGDVAAFAEAMNKLIKNKIQQFSLAAKEKLDHEFNATETVRNHIAYFNRILQQK